MLTRMRILLPLIVMAAVLASCGPPTPTPSATPAPRRASAVVITLVQPTSGEVVHGTTVHVVVRVSGGTITNETTANPDPSVGHVHLYLQNKLIYMSYTLSEDVPVTPGLTYSMHAEWVGADHLPFSPRDVTPSVFFSVAT